MKNSKKIVSSILAASVILGVSACGGSGDGGGRNTDTTTAAAATTTTTAATTLDTDAALQEIVADKSDDLKLDDVESVDKKIKWLAWWDIDETSAACELFKAQYGIPEEGNDSYGAEFANEIFVWTNVAYADRYDRLGQLVAAGDSPDIFPFEIGYFPLSAIMNMFQPIDGIVDTTTDDWAEYRSTMDQFMWGGKNWCAIMDVNPNYVLFYRRSVCEDAGITDPYTQYQNGEWTWDAFLSAADTFQNSGDSKYAIDGWNIADFFIATTGVPMVGIEDGLLVSHLNDPAVERAMSFIETLASEDYRYPWDLNGWSTNFRAWMNGDTLFFADGYWTYEEQTMQKAIEKYGWEDNDVFYVPFPRDPNADGYYQMMKQDAVMFCGGATNKDGFKAYTNCMLQASKDEDVSAQQREKSIRDFGWTEELLDARDEFKENLLAVWDFKYGVSVTCAQDGMDDSPTRNISARPYTFVDAKYTQLRGENEQTINSQIEEANSKA
ncbi:MAG: extracellular solute-binding protein [Bacteroides sp.]|nr:extracellular solute-binding protein [Eubacterium sp.]MCM1419588.1 extracellular solute-binding protein [Roseburia sp.]MCM1463541.1 extracellular solute-binding protein [Bacteroides sp.]